MRNAQLVGGARDDGIADGADEDSGLPLSQAPFTANDPGLPLSYDPAADRFRVLRRPDAIGSYAPTDETSANAEGFGVDAASKAAGGVDGLDITLPARALGVLGRAAANTYDTFRRTMTVDGTPADPSPGNVFRDWATGDAPQSEDFGPESRFTKEFVQAPSVQEHIRKAIGAWKARPGGWEARGGRYTNGRASFGPKDFIADAIADNAAAHEIGSFGLGGQKRGGRIDWTATNDMGQHSYFYGHALDAHHLPSVPQVQSGPRHTVRQTIRFSTDLEGRPIGG